MDNSGRFPYRLIACDMDGTLLDANGNLPEGFARIFDRLSRQGVIFAPASGRQLATLRSMFAPFGKDVSFIAENGTVVVMDGEVISTTALPADQAHSVIDAVDKHNNENAHPDLFLVVCHPERASILPAPLATKAELEKYYHALTVVPDVAALHAAVDDQEVIKLAIYGPGMAEDVTLPLSVQAAPELSAVVSGAAWVDIMAPGANKGVALESMAKALGIGSQETLAFGDYLNDYALLEAAGTAVAMENAHSDLKAIADVIAPPNTEAGVIVFLEELLDAAELEHS